MFFQSWKQDNSSDRRIVAFCQSLGDQEMLEAAEVRERELEAESVVKYEQREKVRWFQQTKFDKHTHQGWVFEKHQKWRYQSLSTCLSIHFIVHWYWYIYIYRYWLQYYLLILHRLVWYLPKVLVAGVAPSRHCQSQSRTRRGGGGTESCPRLCHARGLQQCGDDRNIGRDPDFREVFAEMDHLFDSIECRNIWFRNDTEDGNNLCCVSVLMGI